ncbi:MAG: ATP-binding protein [Bacteroidota bacterium]
MSTFLARNYRKRKEANLSLAKSNQELQLAKRTLASKNKVLEKYIDSNIQLEQFAHVASHDLREPAIVINNYANLLKQKSANKLNDSENIFIDFIEANSSQMLNLVNDLLDYSKINSQRLNLKPVDVNELLESVIHIYDHKLKDANIEVRLDDTFPKIVADEIKLKRIFQNLLSNAIKFSQVNDSPLIEVGYRDRGTHWEFSIKDNGIGIEEKDGEKIFDPYVRLNNRSEFSGTGLGLAICKRIVEKHQGKINFDSVPGKGTRFYFTIAKDLEGPTGGPTYGRSF